MMKTGISDIALFIPRLRMQLEDLVRERGSESARLEKKLIKAIETTGQKAFSFPDTWEDSVTIAAEAVRKLINQDPQIDPQKLRYLISATETSIDHSKPLAAYIQGMLQKNGINVGEFLTTFQVQHACAAGTLALLSVLSMLETSAASDESGIVVSSDIARYQEMTTAEITQGAGAAAVSLSREARLLYLDLAHLGFSSHDVDDFFRPLGQDTAEVKGYLSVQCYHHSLQSSYEDYCRRSGQDPKSAIKDIDYFVLHTPFRNMPEAGMLMLLHKYCGFTEAEAAEELARRSFYSGIDPIADIGNVYTASVFMTLAFLLHNEYKKIGNDIVGKKMLMFSYGSGNTMAAVAATVAPEAPQVIAGWDLDAQLAQTKKADFDCYQQWLNFSKNGKSEYSLSPDGIKPGSFYLKSIRQDGYREYDIAAET